jgi:hypothetical protein
MSIKIILRKIVWDGMDWIELVQDKDQWRAPVNTMMNLRFLRISGNFLNGCTIGSFSGRAQLCKEGTAVWVVNPQTLPSILRIPNLPNY